MQASTLQAPKVLVSSSKNKALPVFALINSLPFCSLGSRRIRTPSSSLQCQEAPKLELRSRTIRAHALNAGTRSGGFEERHGSDNHNSSHHVLVMCACTVGFLLVLFTKGPSSILPILAKSGFTAAFSLIFVSEIGDKTFFIAALLAMQYDKCLVFIGSLGALSLMTILSVVIGRIFHSLPVQFQTTLPIGEYAAVTLLMFFGLKSIKDAWDLPSPVAEIGEPKSKVSDEFVEAEELVKKKVSKRLSNPLEVLWKSFSLVFFAEWGDRSMLATVALGAAQSPWGVTSGAVVGHVLATAIAILGGAFLSKHISEKLVGYVGGVLFLVFAVATFFGVF